MLVRQERGERALSICRHPEHSLGLELISNEAQHMKQHLLSPLIGEWSPDSNSAVWSWGSDSLKVASSMSSCWIFPGLPGPGDWETMARDQVVWMAGVMRPSLQSWWAGQEVQPRIVPARRKDALSCGFSSFLGLWNSCRLSPRHPPRGEPFSRGWQRFLFLACLPGCYDQKSMGEAEKTQNVKIRCV